MAMCVIWIIILCASSTSQGQMSISGSGEYSTPESGQVSVITHLNGRRRVLYTRDFRGL